MKKSYRLTLPIILTVLFMLNSCHSKLDPFNGDGGSGGKVGGGTGFVQTIGIGAADQNITNKTQRMAASRNAAIVASQFEMLIMIKTLQYLDGTTVGSKISTDPSFANSVNDLIKSATLIKTEFTNDDGAIVTIQLTHREIQTVTGNVRDF